MKILLTILFSIFLMGCSSEKTKAIQEAQMHEIKENRIAREFVQNRLKDPDSAQFRNQKGFCGEVNSKNGFGAYTGFKKFIAASSDLIVMEADMKPNEFKMAWDNVCK